MGAELLRGLSLDELTRLEQLLEAVVASGGRGPIDLAAAIEAMRSRPTPPRRSPQDRTQFDGGRRYELTLYDPLDIGNKPGLSGDELDERYETEWRYALELEAIGCTLTEAWAKIRQDARVAEPSWSATTPMTPPARGRPRRRRIN